MRRKKALSRFLLCATVLFCFGLLEATTAACAALYVPDDYVTIQEGIKAARNGDTVIVRDGTYLMTSPVTFRGKAITVRSENGPEGCILDANGRSVVVAFNCWETKDSVLSGFTITNGNPSYGTITFFYSSPTISNCIITGNKGEYAGGLWIESYSSPTISDCTISGNSGKYAGGIICAKASPIITNCNISGNTSSSVGGISVSNSFPIITNCTISRNTGAYAGAILCFPDTSSTITNCLISGNTSGHTGGIRCLSNASPTITSCTLTGNTGESGGAILSLPSSAPIVTNCILWADSPDEIADGSTPVVSFSDVEGGWPGAMNIDTDPSFIDPAGGDYHLRSDSPCIDAGDNAAAALSETDMEGNPRIIGGTVDMGAYEYKKHALPLVRIEAVDAVASEPGQDRGRFRVIRSRDASRDLTVRYAVSGTARNRKDYKRLTGVVTIPAGKSIGVVRVQPLDDLAPEPKESVFLTLVESTSYEVGKERRARVVIRDDD